MSLAGAPILIAAVSARALAASARRAGFVPLAADRFGDEDLLAVAAAWEPLAGAPLDTFAADDVMAALDGLSARAPTPPVGLVLGAGFEDAPDLVTRLASRHRLLGCDAAAIARCTQPELFFPLLAALDIPHPETALEPPANKAGWLSKAVGGAGGAHIRPADRNDDAGERRYWQRLATGEPLSLAAIAAQDGFRPIGFSAQWSAPAPGALYRFGGAAGPRDLPDALAARIERQGARLAAELGLTGLVSFDGLRAGDNFLFLEVNPRPGASLDLFDDQAGSLFAAHIAAATGATIETLPPRPAIRALMILYADRGALSVPRLNWPAWTADRSAPGTAIAAGAPLCTVFAGGHDPGAATAEVKARAAAISAALYAAAETERTLSCPSP